VQSAVQNCIAKCFTGLEMKCGTKFDSLSHDCCTSYSLCEEHTTIQPT